VLFSLAMQEVLSILFSFILVSWNILSFDFNVILLIDASIKIYVRNDIITSLLLQHHYSLIFSYICAI